MIRLDSRTAVVALLALLLAPAAYAEVRTSAVSTPDTPEARLGAWIQSLQDFAVRNPELTPEQAGLIFDAQRAAEPRLFTDRPGEAEVKVLADNLRALKASLPCGAYSDLHAEFGELQSWLQESGVATAAPADCTCGDDDDCGGDLVCKAVECVSKVGTTHWGRCGRATTTAEPEPTEPTVP